MLQASAKNCVPTSYPIWKQAAASGRYQHLPVNSSIVLGPQPRGGATVSLHRLEDTGLQQRRVQDALLGLVPFTGSSLELGETVLTKMRLYRKRHSRYGRRCSASACLLINILRVAFGTNTFQHCHVAQSCQQLTTCRYNAVLTVFYVGSHVDAVDGDSATTAPGNDTLRPRRSRIGNRSKRCWVTIGQPVVQECCIMALHGLEMRRSISRPGFG